MTKKGHSKLGSKIIEGLEQVKEHYKEKQTQEQPLKCVGFDMHPEAIEDLDKLVKLSGLSSRKDLLNEALSFFEFCLESTRNSGRAPTVFNENGQITEIVGGPFAKAIKAYKAEKSKQKE